MNQNLFDISPEVMEQFKKVGEYFTIDIRKNRSKGRIEITYNPTNPCPYFDVGTMVDEMSNQLAWGHATMFGMKGQITNAD